MPKQAKKAEVMLNPGECQDCQEQAPHRLVCPGCSMLLCPWCWSHIHVLGTKNEADRARVEKEWDAAQAMCDPEGEDS